MPGKRLRNAGGKVPETCRTVGIQSKISPNSNLMYYGNNSADIFSPPEYTRIHAHTELNNYYYKCNSLKISTVKFSPPRPSDEFTGIFSLAKITHYMVLLK